MNYKPLLLFVILMIGCLAQFSSDIYAPSLPGIAEDLATSIDHVQWSMAIFMLGLALSQLLYGPLSEGYGRRIPLFVGLSIMLLGSVICFLASSIYVLILGRLVQGCGAGAGSALWRSIFRDTFSGDELAKYSSYLSIFIIFIIPAAPVLGGYLHEMFTWRAIFVFLIAYTVCNILVVKYVLHETNVYHDRQKLRLNYIRETFKQLLSSNLFMGYTCCAFLSYGAFFAWFTTGPVLCIQLLGIQPSQFGWLSFIFTGIASACAGWINGKCVVRLGSHTMLRIAWLLMFSAGFLMMVFEIFYGLTLWNIILPASLFSFGVSLVFPNIFARSFSPFGKIAGYAGALYGFMQISGAAVIGGLVSYLPETDQRPLAILFMLCPILALFIFEFFIKDH